MSASNNLLARHVVQVEVGQVGQLQVLRKHDKDWTRQVFWWANFLFKRSNDLIILGQRNALLAKGFALTYPNRRSLKQQQLPVRWYFGVYNVESTLWTQNDNMSKMVKVKAGKKMERLKCNWKWTEHTACNCKKVQKKLKNRLQLKLLKSKQKQRLVGIIQMQLFALQ